MDVCLLHGWCPGPLWACEYQGARLLFSLFPLAPKHFEGFSKEKEDEFASFQTVFNWDIRDDYPLLMTFELLEQLRVNKPSCDLVHVQNMLEDDAWKMLFIFRLPHLTSSVC